jgi:hypothetical protein
MRFYDIFNGDADGICALHQLRLSQPRDAELVTGVKRDNRLLARVHPAAGDELTVLDVSLAENREDLLRILAVGASCRYFDHHHAGAVPSDRLLEAHIDASDSVCTSLIVDRHLGGAHRAWAVVAAFGDNLAEPARHAARSLGIGKGDSETLRALGECLNYNAYGETIDDLHFHPADLYRRLQPYADPLEFAASAPEFASLRQAYADDMARSRAVAVEQIGPHCAAAFLPNEKWARRVMGVLANALALEHPHHAHAVLLEKEGGYTVSLRAPQAPAPGTKVAGIDEIARLFPGGNGRAKAAGIPLLPASQTEALLDALRSAYDR